MRACLVCNVELKANCSFCKQVKQNYKRQACAMSVCLHTSKARHGKARHVLKKRSETYILTVNFGRGSNSKISST